MSDELTHPNEVLKIGERLLAMEMYVDDDEGVDRRLEEVEVVAAADVGDLSSRCIFSGRGN